MTWHRMESIGELDDGRVTTAEVDGRTLAVCRVGDRYGALDNHCPHQGGPLGEGTIENGWLRCPWHGYDYNPLDGQPPEGFTDAPTCFTTEVRDDGVWVDLPEVTRPPRTVADVIVDTMIDWGVTHVFGMVGHSNLGLADAMRRAEEAGRLTYIGIRHEGAAAFAASAFGKLTGRPAACLAIAGPGSTNLLTGLYDAKVDGSPVLAISGQVPSKDLGRGAFQDLDLTAAFADVAVTSRVVLAGSNHAELTAIALKAAIDHRGVAHLVVPDEVQVLPVDDVAPSIPTGRLAVRREVPAPDSVANAAAMIRESSRPVIIVGHGARGAASEVVELAERLGAPILTTFKAKGLVADRHALAGGVLGRSGTPVASWLMNESDLLIVVGASFSNHTGIAPYKAIIQVDDEPGAIGRFHPVTASILGDASVGLAALLGEISGTTTVDQRADVARRWALWRTEKARRAADDHGRGVASAAVFDALGRHCPDDAIIAVDVGNHAYAFGRYFESGGQPVLMSGYLGSIGFGLPAAIGAASAEPGRPVVAVTGDGGFGQYLAELTTAVAHRLPIRHMLLDNSMLAKISKEQRAARYPVWQTHLHNPDFAAYAELCGAHSVGVRAAGELDGALSAAFAADGPSLVHIHSDPDLV